MLPWPEQGGAVRLVLVRHAATAESARGRCYGRTDVPLSAAGRDHARALGEALEALPLAAVYASPLARALETARPIAAALGLEPLARDGLRELDFGELEGLRYDQIEAEHPGLFRRWLDGPGSVRFPGGESLAEVRERVLAALAEIRGLHEGEAAAIVAHGGVLRIVLADALGLRDEAIFRIDQDFGGVSVVDWLDGVPLVRALNALLYSPGWPAGPPSS